MDPKALIREGHIDEARAMLADQVKKAPSDIQARSVLFQVMLLCGEWDKARRQLEIVAAQQTSTNMNLPVYRQLIEAEKERLAVARMETRPAFFPEIPSYGEVFFQALDRLKNEKIDEAQHLFDTIDADLPPVQGTLNGEPFTGFRDTDTSLAYFIEAIEYERYLWVPIGNIRELAVAAPQNLIDLIWAKGRITTWEGLTMGCFLPVLYPNSFESGDDRIRLGRLTDWQPLGGPFASAVGQHVYDIGGRDHALFEIKEALFTLAGSDEKGDAT
jgi:type VI secretion system protein ImpE